MLAGAMGKDQGGQEIGPGMEKRNLRVVKWIGTVPAVAVCTSCNREFKVPVSFMKRVSDAQQTLKNAFAEHKCQSEHASQTTP